jgi:hypothetical protein
LLAPTSGRTKTGQSTSLLNIYDELRSGHSPIDAQPGVRLYDFTPEPIRTSRELALHSFDAWRDRVDAYVEGKPNQAFHRTGLNYYREYRLTGGITPNMQQEAPRRREISARARIG